MPDLPLLGLGIDSSSRIPLFEQLYSRLRERISCGQLPAGSRLPPSRKLAEELGVSRTTIVTAYDQLIDEGFVYSKQGAGIFISETGELELLEKTTDRALRKRPSNSASALPRPFFPGRPDDRLFPYRQWAQCIARVARREPEALVRSLEPFGDPELRYEICRYLAEWRGVQARPEQVLITAGAGDGLELCIHTLSPLIDGLELENPGYPLLRTFVRSLGIAHHFLHMDENGALTPSTHNAPPTPRMAILTPSSQFPLGGAMPAPRRSEFIEWAASSGSWILEDDYDSEFRYAGRPVPAMSGLDPHQRILYIGSFSKVFSNGLRLGYIVLPHELIPLFTNALSRFGSNASIVPQRPLARFLAEGEYYRHIRRVRRVYAERRVALIELLEKQLAKRASFTDHRAGMQLAVSFPEINSDVSLTEQAAEQGIACSALSGYYAGKPARRGLLMGFCSFTPEEMSSAMTQLKSAVARCMKIGL